MPTVGWTQRRVLGHRARVLEALVLLVLARLLRRFVPMRRWSGLLGDNRPATEAIDVGALSGAEARVARAVAGAARRLDANCLEQAVAASLMLRVRRHPGAVVIGLDSGDPGGVPHAWLVGASGRVVTGGERGTFRPVNQFGRGAAAGREWAP